MIRTFVQTTALVLTLISAVFLTRGNLALTAQVIAELSTSKWGYSAAVVDSLAAQRGDTWIGVAFLLTAFALQLGNALWPMRWKDFEVSKAGVASAVVVSVLLFFGGLAGSKFIAKTTKAQALAILQAAQMPSQQP